jgi:hypothetical protein
MQNQPSADARMVVGVDDPPESVPGDGVLHRGLLMGLWARRMRPATCQRMFWG